MIRKTFFIIVVTMCIISTSAKAQLSAQKEAMYFATIKAVADYKINDEENLKDLEKLRQDAKFNENLNKMMEKLQNSKSKNNINRRIYNILRSAGKQIYNELN